MKCAFLFLVGATAVATAKAVALQERRALAQIEWLRSKGGVFSDKIELQRVHDGGGEDTAFGVFASTGIKKGETLMIIPGQTLLGPAGRRSKGLCDTAIKLERQYELGEKSKYWPYVDYVMNTKQGNVPSAWSEEGKKLLRFIRGKELRPKALTSMSFEKHCGFSSSTLRDRAYAQVISRGLNEYMVPVYDMVNHRNGNWTNLDSSSPHLGRDVFVFSLRDIVAGEQLYFSYTNVTDANAPGHTAELFKHYGFIEEYPRTFQFFTKPDVIFEIDEVAKHDTPRSLLVNWISAKPDMFQVNTLRGYLKRLVEMEPEVYKRAGRVGDTHERKAALEFYESIRGALQAAIWDVSVETNTTGYDSLTPLQQDAMGSYFADSCYADLNDRQDLDKGYVVQDYVKSHHQHIEVSHNDALDDTCLWLHDSLQTCTSFRAHYSEAIVHYPARFVNKVKRVLFMGGGDNMLLHEILKYPSLELVVGLELDQQVVRSSFKGFGIQPHFEDDRVQWWFGDATKSVRMLPQEYIGTFDLVLVDLETKLVRKLKVGNDDLTLLDAAALMMKPDGVMARNEDFWLKTECNATDYALGLYYNQVPIICEQSVYVESNKDLYDVQQTDHGVETLALPSFDEKNPYEAWFDYASNTRRKRTDPAALATAMEEAKGELGVLMILEAENTELFLTRGTVLSTIGKTLNDLGLTRTSVAMSSSDGMDEGDEIVFILKEGYIVSRTWPNRHYCAFDIQLWNGSDRLDEIKAALVSAVGSDSVSSYNLITGGFHGIEQLQDSRVLSPVGEQPEQQIPTNDKVVFHQEEEESSPSAAAPSTTGSSQNLMPSPDHLVSSSAAVDAQGSSQLRLATDGSCFVPHFVKEVHPSNSSSSDLCQGRVFTANRQDTDHSSHVVVNETEIQLSAIDVIHSMGASLIQESNVTVVVVCGAVSDVCTSIDAISAHSVDFSVVPLWSCENLPADVEHAKGAKEIAVNKCEAALLGTIQRAIQFNGPVGGIVVDPSAPKAMGQLLLQLMRRPGFRQHLVSDKFVVLGAVQDEAGSWRSELVERFRTDFKFYPAHRASVVFGGGNGTEIGLPIFSSGDISFFSHMTEVFDAIETQTGMTAEVRGVKNGLKDYVAEHNPPRPTNSDYDHTPSLVQWFGQEPLGRQTLIQFDVDPPVSFSVGEKVLINRKSVWKPGRIDKKKADGRFSVSVDGSTGKNKKVTPDKLRKVESNESDRSKASSDFCATLLTALQSMKHNGFSQAEARLHTTHGNGCILISFWAQGSVILVWNGVDHLDANLFSFGDRNKIDFEKFVVSNVPSIRKAVRDEHPRGIGDVVNFKKDLRSPHDNPHWASAEEIRQFRENEKL